MPCGCATLPSDEDRPEEEDWQERVMNQVVAKVDRLA
jgi:hypothetical protein